MRPLLRWAGSKKQLLGVLRPYWERSLASRYIEPFAGSAALFFDLAPPAALLGDMNETLVNFYQCLQADARQVYELSMSWDCDEATYYRIRNLFKSETDKVHRSAMFFYLNRNCFNGIYRTNTDGHFNVPFSGTKTGAMPSWGEITDAVSLLRSARVEASTFLSLIEENVRAGDFVYLDPPYAVENRRVFVQYNAQTFGLSDLQQLADVLHCIDAVGAKFVLSYAVSTEALHFFRHWPMRRVSCQRNVSGFTDHRRKAMEFVISNVDVAEAQ